MKIFGIGSSQNTKNFLQPQPPTIGTATDVGTNRAYNDGSATVTFTPSASGAAATSYVVKAYNTSGVYQNISASGSSSPITLTGLASNTSYKFTVYGVNAAGNGSESSFTTPDTLITTVPQAPTIGTATATGTTTATVAFTGNGTGGKAISTYTATASPAAGSGSGASSPISYTGLSASTNYTFTVTATNANGTSAASSASNQITTQAPTYSLAQTFTTSGTFTVPAGHTKLAAYVVSGGQSGSPGNAGRATSTLSKGNQVRSCGNGGPGGYGGAITAFTDYSVSGGQTFTVTVGGANGTSSFGNIASAQSTGTVAGGTSNALGGNGGGGGTGEFWDVNTGDWYGYANAGSPGTAATGTVSLGSPGVSGYSYAMGGGGGGVGGSSNQYYGPGSDAARNIAGGGSGGRGSNIMPNQGQSGGSGGAGASGGSGTVIVYTRQ